MYIFGSDYPYAIKWDHLKPTEEANVREILSFEPKFDIFPRTNFQRNKFDFFQYTFSTFSFWYYYQPSKVIL